MDVLGDLSDPETFLRNQGLGTADIPVFVAALAGCKAGTYLLLTATCARCRPLQALRRTAPWGALEALVRQRWPAKATSLDARLRGLSERSEKTLAASRSLRWAKRFGLLPRGSGEELAVALAEATVLMRLFWPALFPLSSWALLRVYPRGLLVKPASPPATDRVLDIVEPTFESCS